ncbi:hypothetical protein Bca52824_087325 [Brassica carinata]|uniref:Uncharacterized protein n=1 Tax=Brassica carinata TaxID=52824 RepID=A0A8X7TMV0_BRACI|nr:hypothetical protein Bca52824_087325 [Brassica carinata]
MGMAKWVLDMGPPVRGWCGRVWAKDIMTIKAGLASLSLLGPLGASFAFFTASSETKRKRVKAMVDGAPAMTAGRNGALSAAVRCRRGESAYGDHILATLMGYKAGTFEDIVDAYLAYGVMSRYNSQRTSETMGSKDDSEEQFTLNTDYSPPATCDLGTQQLMARLAAEEEIGDLRADGANDGKKQARKRKLISVVDSEEESDVEITPPTRSSKPRSQTTYGTATRKPMLQSTLDGGSGSSARACSEKNVPLKAIREERYWVGAMDDLCYACLSLTSL